MFCGEVEGYFPEPCSQQQLDAPGTLNLLLFLHRGFFMLLDIYTFTIKRWVWS